MEKKQTIGIVAIVATVIAAAVLMFTKDGGFGADAFKDLLPGFGYDWGRDALQFGKNLDIWFMLMLVAFLMIFIRKFEWGVALAVLLSAAASFIVYLGIQQIWFEELWTQQLLIRAVICAITVVIAIGVFLGTCKMWQYLLVGALFSVVYAFIEWLLLGQLTEWTDLVVTDDGGSVLVHMCAAYFGLGVALGIRDKRAFDEPMYTTTHSVTFVWLASMLLWMLWPSFVTSLLPGTIDVTKATITCYMAGVGSVISTYAMCMIFQGKVNPLVYTYAMLCGPVAIGAPLLQVGPWGALLIGLIAGIISTTCFIYLQPWFCSKIGVLDIMGVHNLHGVGGWFGAICVSIVLAASGAGFEASVGTLVMAVITVAVTLVTGAVIGIIVKLTRGDMEICTDDTDFIKNEAPA